MWDWGDRDVKNISRKRVVNAIYGFVVQCFVYGSDGNQFTVLLLGIFLASSFCFLSCIFGCLYVFFVW